MWSCKKIKKQTKIVRKNKRVGVFIFYKEAIRDKMTSYWKFLLIFETRKKREILVC